VRDEERSVNSQFLGITVYQWLKVLAVPITVGAVVPWLNWLQRRRERYVDDQRAKDEALQSYLDKMSQLLIDEELHNKWGDYDETRVTARAQTLAVLERLDPKRKRTVLLFLREARLINRDKYSPKEEPNRTYYAHYVGLKDADFSGAELEGARLISTLGDQPISLKGANLKDAKLSKAILHKADLSDVDLRGSELHDAELHDADLSGADLRGAKGVTKEQLEEQTTMLGGATMPDGSIHP
jgi:hypothetical protein